MNRRLLVVMLLAQAWACAAFGSPSDDVKNLAEQGKMADAYAEAKKYPDQLGDPAFDFYFGIAAIDSGHAGEGVLALERYLLNFPENISARLQLSRGYFVLGEDARAREEFEALRKLDPPPDTAATIDRFLDAIRLRETRYTPSAGGYMEFGLGNDSNVNAGVTSASIFLPTFGQLTVSQAAQKIGDNFASLGLGGFVSYPVAPGVALFGNGAAEQRQLSDNDNHQYQLGSLDLTGGVSVLREKNLYKLSLSQGIVTVGNRNYRTATGPGVEWRYQLSELQSVNAGATYAVLRYNDPNGAMDATFWGVNAGYRRQFTGTWEPAFFAGASYGEQHSTQSRPDLVPHSVGLNAGVSFTPRAKWGVAASVMYVQNDYQDVNILAGETRHDKYRAFNGVVSYLVTRNISVRGEVLLSRNDSNIPLYEFPRDVYMLKMRYEFK
jgi:hypothetical protein